jgi:hypothetical protein
MAWFMVVILYNTFIVVKQTIIGGFYDIDIVFIIVFLLEI